MPETTRLKKTIDAWWPEIETFILTRATNARTEAANVTIKNMSAPAAATGHQRTTGAASRPGGPTSNLRPRCGYPPWPLACLLTVEVLSQGRAPSTSSRHNRADSGR